MKTWLNKLNIEPNDFELYVKALTHSSYANEHNTEKNERLEFLGDAILGLLMAEYLYNEMNQDEGKMSKRRSLAVRQEALVLYAESIQLKKYLLIGKGEQSTGPNDKMIADAFEAFLGAIFLDQGFQFTKEFFTTHVLSKFDKTLITRDYKSLLQEYIQSGDKRNVSYHVVSETGPSHQKHFKVVVKLDKNITLGDGEGSTIKEAEQNAAQNAIKKGNYDTQEDL
jgi:ribonuclease-3